MELPDDCPRGPWRTFAEASADLSAWVLVNGFKMIKDSGTTPANSRSGAKGSLACSFARAAPSTATQRKTTAMGDYGSKCPFRINLEESTTGWAIYSAHTCHSDHKFNATVDSATTTALAAGGGKIPEQLLDAGVMVRAAGLSTRCSRARRRRPSCR